MNRRRCVFILLCFMAPFCIGVPTAAAQKLTDQWVEEAAAPLVNDRVVDGLSVGYIEGDRTGIVHLGSVGTAGQKPNDLTLYEIGSISKVFTGLLLADAVARGTIDLNAAAAVVNPAGIRMPSREGQPITWLNLSTHRSGLPRLPGNLLLTDPTNPYAKYDSVLAAKFLDEYKLPRAPWQVAGVFELRRIRSWIPSRAESRRGLSTFTARANREAVANDRLRRSARQRSIEASGDAS